MKKLKFRAMCVLWILKVSFLLIPMPFVSLGKIIAQCIPEIYGEWRRVVIFNCRVWYTFCDNLIEAFRIGKPLPPPVSPGAVNLPRKMGNAMGGKVRRHK